MHNIKPSVAGQLPTNTHARKHMYMHMHGHMCKHSIEYVQCTHTKSGSVIINALAVQGYNTYHNNVKPYNLSCPGQTSSIRWPFALDIY